jgi:hypothetical protein
LFGTPHSCARASVTQRLEPFGELAPVERSAHASDRPDARGRSHAWLKAQTLPLPGGNIRGAARGAAGAER